MSTKSDQIESLLPGRRRVLKAVGGSAALVTVAGLAGCGGESPAPEAPANPRPANVTGTGNDTAQSEPMDRQDAAATEQSAAQEDMPRLDPSDPQAQALAYKHDASSINADEQPRYESGQACRNCSLYSGADGAAWGPCSIFAGKLVAAGGWCNVYAPKA